MHACAITCLHHQVPATTAAVFWTPVATDAFPNVVHNLLELATFPSTIYGALWPVFRTFVWPFAFVLPFAFISYYPAVALLGRQSQAVTPPWLAYVAPLCGPLVALLVAQIWRRGLARYQGAGH